MVFVSPVSWLFKTLHLVRYRCQIAEPIVAHQSNSLPTLDYVVVNKNSSLSSTSPLGAFPCLWPQPCSSIQGLFLKINRQQNNESDQWDRSGKKAEQ